MGTQFRFAKKEDVSLILSFIKELAEYEKMSSDVIADEKTLTKWIFDERKADVIFAIENEKEVLKKSNKELKFKLQNSRYKLLDLEKKLNDANFNLAIEKKIKNQLLK